MIVYGVPFSPFVMRPLLVARAKGHELPVTPEPELAEYLAIHPLGKIPCLVDGDFVLPESAVIADYLDAILDGQALWPTDPKARAKAALLARLMDVNIAIGIFRAIRGMMAQPADTAAIEEGRAQVRDGFRAIEHFRNADDEWLAGDSFGHADAALLPMLFITDYFDARLGLGELLRAHPGVAAYWARAKASPIGARMVDEMQTGLDAFLASRPS